MGTESEERLQLIVFYRDGHETGGLDLDKKGSEDLLLAYLLHWPGWLLELGGEW